VNWVASFVCPNKGAFGVSWVAEDKLVCHEGLFWIHVIQQFTKSNLRIPRYPLPFPKVSVTASQGIRYHSPMDPWIHFCNGFFMFTFLIEGMFINKSQNYLNARDFYFVWHFECLTKRLPLVYLTKKLPVVHLTKNLPVAYLTKKLPVIYLTKKIPLVYLTKKLPVVYLTKKLPVIYLTKKLPEVYLRTSLSYI